MNRVNKLTTTLVIGAAHCESMRLGAGPGRGKQPVLIVAGTNPSPKMKTPDQTDPASAQSTHHRK